MGIEDSGARVKFPGTKVFDANAPAAMTDLDLSAVVGARKAFVCLRVVKADTVNAMSYFARTNGITSVLGTYASSYSDFMANAERHSNIVLVTDSSGIIEHYGDVADNLKIYVEAYAVV